MVYADDLACWREEEEEVVKRLMIGFARCLEEVGLKMNVEKTVIMSIGREEGEATEIITDGKRVKI